MPMLIAPIEGSGSTLVQAETPNILAAALGAATKAATGPFAMAWSSRSLKTGELPPELTKNRAHLAIYLLPRAFASLGSPMASAFAELWLFGVSKRRVIERTIRPYPKPPLRICHYKLSDFGGSETVKTVVQAVLQKAIDTLPQMSSVETALDQRWEALRRVATEAAALRKNDDQWNVATPSFIGVLETPSVLLETRGIGATTYIANGETPFSSDAYGALGKFSARAYLEAILSKKAGDDRIFVKPTRVGVRIWDDYDFKDFDESELDLSKPLARVYARLTSQFLGIWNDTDSEDVVVLRNSHFHSFREEFMPVYNRQTPAPATKMICEDYSSVSDYATQVLQDAAEYPLYSLKA
jgi:hypothetical protein